MAQRVVATQIGSDGPVVQLEVADADVGAGSGGEEDVTALSDVLSFDAVVDQVAAVAEAMTGALRRARPEEAEVTFSLDVSVQSGHLTSLIVKGSASGTFTVRLLWKAAQ